ncbi:MAG TPA: hypothetical protein EYN91_01925 [Candidatus Melainabacteria bacterium]|jgi:uncharacterized protein|nr:hypothetical protein [Candidatus Melainabacteria bacterium]
MNRKEEEIKKKLLELETSVLKEAPSPLASDSKSTTLTTGGSQTPATTVKSDLCYFGGLGLIGVGILMMFQHVTIGSGFLGMLGFGGGGFGLLLVPLMFGIGWMFYDSKSRAGWMITAGSCALIFFAILSSLRMNFASIPLLSMIMMLLPFAVGGALLLKGMGGPKGVEDALKKEIKQIKKEKDS